MSEHIKQNDGVSYKEAVLVVAGAHPELYEAVQG